MPVDDWDCRRVDEMEVYEGDCRFVVTMDEVLVRYEYKCVD